MRKQDYLLYLIKSLSASEKRYFRIFCRSASEGKKYMRLFNVLEKQNEYNPAVLSKILNTTPANLAHEKEYLQEVLLRNLRLFNETHLPHSKAMAEYMEAEMLYNKGMSEYCISRAEKLLARAVMYEWFLLVQHLTRLLSRAYYRTGRFDEMLKMNRLEKETAEANLQYQGLVHLRDQFIKPVMARKNFTALANMAGHPLLKTKSAKLKSWHARQCREEIYMYLYQYVAPNPARALMHAKKRISIFKRHAMLKSAMPANFFVAYNALAIRLHQSGKHSEALAAIDDLIAETLLPIPEVPAQILQHYNEFGKLTKMTLLTFAHRFAEAGAYGAEVYKITATLAPGHRITFLQSHATALFYNGDLNGCHRQLTLLINDKTRERVDIQLYARLLFIMLQLQLKNYSMVPYLVKNLRTWKKRVQKDDEGVNELLAWFNRLGKAGAVQKWAPVFSAFKKAAQQNIYAALDVKLAFSKWAGHGG